MNNNRKDKTTGAVGDSPVAAADQRKKFALGNSNNKRPMGVEATSMPTTARHSNSNDIKIKPQYKQQNTATSIIDTQVPTGGTQSYKATLPLTSLVTPAAQSVGSRGSNCDLETGSPIAQLPINVVDFKYGSGRKKQPLHQSPSKAALSRPQQKLSGTGMQKSQKLTVTKGKIQISGENRNTAFNPWTPNTAEQRSQGPPVEQVSHPSSLVTDMVQTPSELSNASTDGVNEDVINFGQLPRSKPDHMSGEVTIIDTGSKRAPKMTSKGKNSKLEDSRKEDQLSPFETQSQERRIHSSLIDSFSISGEFAHHMAIQNQQLFEMQRGTHLDSIAKKEESDQQWPADLVPNNKQVSRKPRRVVGLPDLETCQGSEPQFLKHQISPQVARQMELHKYKEARERAREHAIQQEAELKAKLKQRRRGGGRSRSRSKSKSKQSHLAYLSRTESKKPHEELKDENTEFIEGVIGKYIYDYPEFKRRQRNHQMAQSIDAGALNRSVVLPPLESTIVPRVNYKDKLPKLVSALRASEQAFAPTPRVTQSIDFQTFRNSYSSKQAASQIREEDIRNANKDYNHNKALQISIQNLKRNEIDAKIFRHADFDTNINKLMGQHNEALTDFNEFMMGKLDSSNSPFVPSEVARVRKVKVHEVESQAKISRLSQKWEMQEQEKTNPVVSTKDEKVVRLLEYSMSDSINEWEAKKSLNEDISFTNIDVASIPKEALIAASQLMQQNRLDVPLEGTLRVNQTAMQKKIKQAQEEEEQRIVDEDSGDINDDLISIDERQLEAKKALDEGELSKYEAIHKEIQRFPKARASPVDGVKLDADGRPINILTALSPATKGTELGKLLADSVSMIAEDEEREETKIEMDSMLAKRVQDSKEVFDKTVLTASLQQIKSTNMRLKQASLHELNLLIDDYLSDDTNISPLLQVYDQLKEETKLTLPCKSMLQQDQKFFRQALTKLRKAQQIELRWVKDSSISIAREYVNKKNYEIQQLLTKQVRDVYRQYDQMREKAIFFKNETSRLTEQLVQYESRITDLNNSVNTFKAKQLAEDNFIKFINEDKVHCQPQKTSLERKVKLTERELMKNPRTYMPFQLRNDMSLQSYSTFDDLGQQQAGQRGSALSLHCDCTLKTFARMQNKYFEKLVNFQERGQEAEKPFYGEYGLKLPSKLKNTSTIAAANHLLHVLPQHQRQMSQSPARMNSRQFGITPRGSREVSAMHINENSSVEGDEFVANSTSSGAAKLKSIHHVITVSPRRSIQDQGSRQQSSSVESGASGAISHKSKAIIKTYQKDMKAQGDDPLLMKPFGFFNSHLTVKTEDMVGVMKDRVVNYYQGRQIQLEEYVGLLESENAYYKQRVSKLRAYRVVLKEKIKELNQRFKHHMVNSQQERALALQDERAKYAELKAISEQTLSECKQIFSMEVHVLEQVLKKSLADSKEKTNLLRTFAFVLKVPRMHHEYIERNGVDPFVDQFTKVLAENKALKDEMERIGENRRVRKAVSLVKDRYRTEARGGSTFTNALPLQIELLIQQRSKFLGKALEEIKIPAGNFKPHLEKKLQAKRRRANALSKSMSLDPTKFAVSQDPYDESRVAFNESVFSSNRVNVIVPGNNSTLQNPVSRHTAESRSKLLSPFVQRDDLGSSTYRNTSSTQLMGQMSQEFDLRQTPERGSTSGDPTMQEALAQEKEEYGGKIDMSSLGDLVKKTLRKRTDFNVNNKDTTQRQTTHHNSQSLDNQSLPEFTQQSKTILHQTYLQALSQSSSLKEIEKRDYQPLAVLARSDANLMTTRTKFLNQYEMADRYKKQREQSPSYKFALSSNLIKSVEEVIKNGSRTKDYIVHKNAQSLDTKPFKKYILTHESKTSLLDMPNDDGGGDDDDDLSDSKKNQLILASYDNQRPFHQQIGMRNWGESDHTDDK